VQYARGVRASYTGKTYTAAWQSLRDDLATRGLVEADGSGVYWPKLSNGQLAALVMAWRRAAARGSATWPLWRDLADAALGRAPDEPRFDMARAHRMRSADPAVVGLLWESTRELAGAMDAAGTVVRPLPVSWTQDSYEQLARDAWEQIKREQAAAGIPAPLLPPPLPEKPPELDIPDDIVDVITDPFRPVRRAVRNAVLIAALLAGGAVLLASRRNRR